MRSPQVNASRPLGLSRGMGTRVSTNGLENYEVTQLYSSKRGVLDDPPGGLR